MMPNNPKQAYCTKFLLRMRTQPPVRTHKREKVFKVMAIVVQIIFIEFSSFCFFNVKYHDKSII